MVEIAPNTTVAIADLTIRGGDVQSSSGGDHPGSGGGILNRGMLTLQRCRVESCFAIYEGAGIRNPAGADLRLEQCTLHGNASGTATAGGGALCNEGEATLLDCVITENTARTPGGGIKNHGKLTLRGGQLRGNRTLALDSQGGGIWNAGALTLADAPLTENQADMGGALVVAGGEATLTNTTLSQNRVRGLGGGAVYVTEGQLQILDFRITDNSPPDFLYGGGLLMNENTSVAVRRTIVSGNLARHGGGIANRGGELQIGDCDFHGNQATNGQGGALNNSGALSIVGSLFAQNAAREGGGIATATSANVTVV